MEAREEGTIPEASEMNEQPITKQRTEGLDKSCLHNILGCTICDTDPPFSTCNICGKSVVHIEGKWITGDEWRPGLKNKL